MSLFKAFEIAGSALHAQSQRLNVVASNLANVDSAAGPDGQTYRARQVVFEAVAMQNGLAPAGSAGTGGLPAGLQASPMGVRVREVLTDQTTPMRTLYDPKHPMANADGYVTLPNVNVVDEVVNMISASRSYQNNVEVMSTARTLLQKTLQLGQ